MKKMEWNEDLSIGIDLIDQQHQTWIAHFNDVADALTTTQEGPKQIAKTLTFLIDYTDFHFATEEKHMARTGYPGLEEHRAKHEELRRTLKNLRSDFEDEGATNPLAQAVDTFLGNWLVDHIHDVDQAFGAYLKEKGLTLTEDAGDAQR